MALTGACSAGAPAQDGPLFVPDADGIVGYQASEGERVLYGFNLVVNKGQSPVTNVTIDLVGSTSADPGGVSFEPSVVVDSRAHDLGYLASGPWPDEGDEFAKWALPLKGFSIPPDPDGRFDLIVPLRVHRKGSWHWPRTRIEYDYAGQHYVEEVNNGFEVCAPAPCS